MRFDFVRRLCLLLVTICILTGCAPANVPPYMALITPILPAGDGLCTGMVVSPTQVLTAGHCAATARRVVTANGQEAWVKDARLSKEHDLALLTVDRVLWVNGFAEFANPQLGVDTLVYGYCPYQVSAVARHAFYGGMVEAEVEELGILDYNEWILPSLPALANKICGGDSGGILIQNSKVVGVISAVESEFFWIALGTTGYSVPPQYIWDLLEQAY